MYMLLIMMFMNTEKNAQMFTISWKSAKKYDSSQRLAMHHSLANLLQILPRKMRQNRTYFYDKN